MQDLPDTLDCCISQETDAITPEEREELKVSGPDCILFFAFLQMYTFFL